MASTSIKKELQNIIGNEYKTIYVLFRYYPEYFEGKIRTIDEIKNTYKMFPRGATEQTCLNWELEENCSRGVVYLLERLHQKRTIEIYETFYKQALEGDVASAKFLTEFSKELFKNKTSELESLLNGIEV